MTLKFLQDIDRASFTVVTLFSERLGALRTAGPKAGRQRSGRHGHHPGYVAGRLAARQSDRQVRIRPGGLAGRYRRLGGTLRGPRVLEEGPAGQ